MGEKENVVSSNTEQNNKTEKSSEKTVDYVKQEKTEEIKKSNVTSILLVAGGIVLCFATGICVF